VKEEASIEAELKGKTLLTYLYLLRRGGGPVGVRELQRALKFSSPSIAAYHLDKLLNLGLVEKNRSGEYYLKREIKIGILTLFMRIGSIIIPRYLFYSVLFTTMLILYVLLYPQVGTIHNIIALIFISLASAIFWYETIRLWRRKPF